MLRVLFTFVLFCHLALEALYFAKARHFFTERATLQLQELVPLAARFE